MIRLVNWNSGKSGSTSNKMRHIAVMMAHRVTFVRFFDTDGGLSV